MSVDVAVASGLRECTRTESPSGAWLTTRQTSRVGVSMKVRLYSLPGSHPGTAVRAMLGYKGIDFKRTDLVPFLSRVILRRVLGFARNTVPAVKIDGRRVQGSREISRELDRVQPDPPLFPSDPEKRLAVQ